LRSDLRLLKKYYQGLGGCYDPDQYLFCGAWVAALAELFVPMVFAIVAWIVVFVISLKNLFFFEKLPC